KPYAVASAAHVTAALDRYAAAWVDGHREACVANRVRQVESDTLFDRRSACLADRRRQLDALASALIRPSPGDVERARVAALGLAPVGVCAGGRGLADAGRDPAPAPLEERAATLKTQYDLGHYTVVAPALDALAADVATHDAPRLAERVLGLQALARMRI